MAASSIVLVTGLQGTGKSTVAEAVARRLRAAVFAWDWSMAALTPFDGVQESLRQMDATTYRAVGWALMLHSARQQLAIGSSVVLDALARDDDVRAVRDLARESAAPAVVVVLRCDDEKLQRERVEQRTRRIPGWHELTWEHVAGTRRQWREPVDTDLVLDSTQPVHALVEAVMATVQPDGTGR